MKVWEWNEIFDVLFKEGFWAQMIVDGADVINEAVGIEHYGVMGTESTEVKGFEEELYKLMALKNYDEAGSYTEVLKKAEEEGRERIERLLEEEQVTVEKYFENRWEKDGEAVRLVLSYSDRTDLFGEKVRGLEVSRENILFDEEKWQRGTMLKIGRDRIRKLMESNSEEMRQTNQSVRIEFVGTKESNKDFDVDEAMDLIAERLYETMTKSADGLYW